MKKILLVFFISFIVLGTNLSFWENSLCEWELWLPPCIGGEYDSNCECILDWSNPGWWANQWWSSSNCPAENVYQSWWRTFCCEYPLENWVCLNCPSNRTYRSNWQILCCPGVVDENWDCQAWLSDVWINISTECLLNWQCGLNVYKVLWIRKQDQNPTVLWFFQDITLASTTAILWTVIIVVIIISWLLFAFASITWKDTKRAKTILIDAFVWLLLVMWSYTIIRLIQFLATAWS